MEQNERILPIDESEDIKQLFIDMHKTRDKFIENPKKEEMTIVRKTALFLRELVNKIENSNRVLITVYVCGDNRKWYIAMASKKVPGTGFITWDRSFEKAPPTLILAVTPEQAFEVWAALFAMEVSASIYCKSDYIKPESAGNMFMGLEDVYWPYVYMVVF